MSRKETISPRAKRPGLSKRRFPHPKRSNKFGNRVKSHLTLKIIFQPQPYLHRESSQSWHIHKIQNGLTHFAKTTPLIVPFNSISSYETFSETLIRLRHSIYKTKIEKIAKNLLKAFR